MSDFFTGMSVTETAVLIGLALPVAVALVTKNVASNTVKGLTLAVLSGVGAVIAILAGEDAPSTITFGFIVTTFAPVFISGVGSYFGLLRALDINAKILPEKGIG